MHRDLVQELRRWEDSGARWQVIARKPAHVTIALLRCDGGEEVERLTSDDPALLAFVGSRECSED